VAWRQEDITITNSRSMIDVRSSGDGDLALFIDGKPAAYEWGDQEGTVATYLMRAGAIDYQDGLASLRHVLEGNLDPVRTMESQLHVLLELFAPGRYRLSMDAPEYLPANTEFLSSWDPETNWVHAYNQDGSWIYTQPTDHFDLLRIEYFRRLLAAGKRPIVILAGVEGGWSDFVIDGHHKLEAYRSRRIFPVVIHIKRLDPQPLDSTNLAELLRNHPLQAVHQKLFGYARLPD
jgi:hypothetical protein